MKTSIRNDTILAILFGSILLILIYNFFIKSTIDANEEMNVLKSKAILSQQATNNFTTLKKKLALIEEKIGNTEYDSTESQHQILRAVSDLLTSDKSIEFQELAKPIIKKTENLEKGVTRIELKGIFINLLYFLNKLEKRNDIGKIISSKFAMKRNQNNTTDLHLYIFIQNIKTNNNEK